MKTFKVKCCNTEEA